MLEDQPVIEDHLAQWWQRRRKRPLTPTQTEQIRSWVQQARQRLAPYASLEDCLQQRGIAWEISQAPHILAGVRFRARLDLHHRRLTIFAGALDELAQPDRPRKLVERVILSHEVFHLLCPDCPGQLQEAAAHYFAATQNTLQEFPGIWDLKAK